MASISAGLVRREAFLTAACVSVGRLLRERRVASGYTLEGAAAAAGISVLTLARLERGVGKVGAANFFRLIELYDVDPAVNNGVGFRERGIVLSFPRLQTARRVGETGDPAGG